MTLYTQEIAMATGSVPTLPEISDPTSPISPQSIQARYDAAEDTDDLKHYWANADNFDADSANSREVRARLVTRSRYEVTNNGYSDGIHQTYATDLVGTGPSLRMLTPFPAFNQLVEKEWGFFAKAISFRQKLWTLAHAKSVDGEGMGVLRYNPRTGYRIPLDLVLHETEQFQTPSYERLLEENHIDGIYFDEYGKPSVYELLTKHPGSNKGFQTYGESELISADYVLHWYKVRRPQQHRGVPECSSTLNRGAEARRWREATVAAAEAAADYAVLLKTDMTPSKAALATPFSTFPMNKKSVMALPAKYEAQQMKAEHPTSNFEGFNKSLINEQARPKAMPYNKAACDSSDYNYASGRLDHQTYYAALDVDRFDGEEMVCDKLFYHFFQWASAIYGWFGGFVDQMSPELYHHCWDWPKHRVADVLQEAKANREKLESGQVFLPRYYSDQGLDFEDELREAAKAFGVTEDELRARLLDAHFPKPGVAGRPQPPAPDDDTEQALDALALRGQLIGRN